MGPSTASRWSCSQYFGSKTKNSPPARAHTKWSRQTQVCTGKRYSETPNSTWQPSSWLISLWKIWNKINPWSLNIHKKKPDTFVNWKYVKAVRISLNYNTSEWQCHQELILSKWKLMSFDSRLWVRSFFCVFVFCVFSVSETCLWDNKMTPRPRRLLYVRDRKVHTPSTLAFFK